MKQVIIEVPDNWHPHFCGLCHPHECNGARGCPVPDGKEAVEVCLSDSLTRTYEGKEIVKHDGKPVKLFVVEDK